MVDNGFSLYILLSYTLWKCTMYIYFFPSNLYVYDARVSKVSYTEEGGLKYCRFWNRLFKYYEYLY